MFGAPRAAVTQAQFDPPRAGEVTVEVALNQRLGKVLIRAALVPSSARMS
jgi:hypothetical protein